MARKVLSKKIRFEVFKRDNFTCQYCGKKAPDVVLELDHIDPVSKGGTNDILNLITSCFDCNRGKSDRKLNDNTVLEKQHEDLEKLNERKKQIEMMFEWKKELLNLDDFIILKICEYWFEITNTTITEKGKENIKKFVKKYDLDFILEAMNNSFNSYKEPQKAFDMLNAVLYNTKLQEEKPYLKNLYSVRYIMKSNMRPYNNVVYSDMLYKLEELHVLHKLSIEELKSACRGLRSKTQFDEYFERMVKDVEPEKND